MFLLFQNVTVHLKKGGKLLSICYFHRTKYDNETMKTHVLILTIFALLAGVITCNGQNRKNLRRPVVAGNYYPSSSGELRSELEELFVSVEDKNSQEGINAIIVPDGSFEKSGKITAAAYSKLNPEKEFVRVFIIGASHNNEFKGISVYKKGDYRTPLGIVKVDNEVVDRLILKNSFIKYKAKAHINEHSIEVQLPYLQYWLKKPSKIVPVIIGTQSAEMCDKLAEVLEPYFTPDNLFIISSDISGITDSNNAILEAINANSSDTLTKTLVSENKKSSPEQIISSIELGPVYTILNVASNKRNIKVEKVDGMSANNAESHSFIIENEIKQQPANVNLTPDDVQFLLRLVRETITQKLKDNTNPEINENELSENLKSTYGAFVTLTINDEIRGNMGKFTTTDPLYKVVQEMAVAAAFRDNRYMPVTKNEIRDMDIEISVVTPLKQVFSSDEIQVGKHGIYMTMYGRSGTFLPQVARITGWNKEEFLGYCARDKAGLGWDGWRTADLFTFEAFVYNRRDAIRRQ